MPTIYIDGVAHEYEGKQKLLQFSLDHGVDVPYFCYHPAMSVPTNCRMCLVEVGFPAKTKEGEIEKNADGSTKINWGRKPVTSCNQDLAPDMHVRTQASSAVVGKAQKGVLEFMLINHPLDCPICDQAGECPLQINTYKYGPEGSRYELEKGHKPKRIELGPRVTLDAERCINCTRCVRFTEEISHTNQLTIISRGESNYPAAAPGKVFDDAYSMNTIDICPVGALTSSAFRFKARVWEMSHTPSLCTGCSNACSVDVWVRDNAVMRLTPRDNMAINQYWICDEGRLEIAQYNENRVSGAKIKGDIPLDLDEALAHAARLVQKHGSSSLFVGSAYASLESNYALKHLAKEAGVENVYYVQHHQAGWGDSFLRKDDRTPNQAACELLGFQAVSADQLESLVAGKGLVYLLEDEAVAVSLRKHFESTAFIIHARNYFAGHERVSLVLPAAHTVEGAGTYIGAKGIAQITMQAKQVKRMTPEMWMGMAKSRLDSAGVPVDNWRNPEHIQDCLPSWLLISRLSQHAGYRFGYEQHKDLYTHLQGEFDVLKGVKLPKRTRKEAFKISQFDFAIK
jgi:NADH-quinone oxidoreductase subunit G